MGVPPLHRLLHRLRLNYGMFWKYRMPTPWDYKQETRFVGAVSLILVMLWLLFSRLDYEAALVQEEVAREAYQNVVASCTTQAIRERKYGEKWNLGFILDDKLIGVDCQVLSEDPYAWMKDKDKKKAM